VSPSIVVIRRRRGGRIFREERFHGRQFRCAHCNGVFLDESEIWSHLGRHKTGATMTSDLPPLDRSLDVRLPYIQDLKEILGRRKPRKDER
jgi:hypothetical protein